MGLRRVPLALPPHDGVVPADLPARLPQPDSNSDARPDRKRHALRAGLADLYLAPQCVVRWQV